MTFLSQIILSLWNSLATAIQTYENASICHCINPDPLES